MKMKIKMFRKIIDERQELEMLRVERVGFWLLYLGLAAAIIVQIFVVDVADFTFTNIAGEFAVLILGCVVSLIGYIRSGSWSYFSKPGMKSYLIASTITAFIVGIFMPLARFFRLGIPVSESLLLFAINFAGMFIVMFLLMWLLGSITKKRQAKLQQDFEEDTQ